MALNFPFTSRKATVLISLVTAHISWTCKPYCIVARSLLHQSNVIGVFFITRDEFYKKAAHFMANNLNYRNIVICVLFDKFLVILSGVSQGFQKVSILSILYKIFY